MPHSLTKYNRSNRFFGTFQNNLGRGYGTNYTKWFQFELNYTSIEERISSLDYILEKKTTNDFNSIYKEALSLKDRFDFDNLSQPLVFDYSRPIFQYEELHNGKQFEDYCVFFLESHDKYSNLDRSIVSLLRKYLSTRLDKYFFEAKRLISERKSKILQLFLSHGKANLINLFSKAFKNVRNGYTTKAFRTRPDYYLFVTRSLSDELNGALFSNKRANYPINLILNLNKNETSRPRAYCSIP